MGVLTVAGIVALAVAVVALIARYVQGMTLPVVATAALAPYLMLGAPLAMIPLAVSGSWIAVAVAGAVTVATVAVQLPWYTRGRAEPAAVVRVVSANLRYGRADPQAIVRIASDHADILAVQERTPEKAELISARAWTPSCPTTSCGPVRDRPASASGADFPCTAARSTTNSGWACLLHRYASRMSQAL